MIYRKKFSAPVVTLEGTFIAGGAILSPIICQDVSDFDVYPKDQSKIFDILIEARETYGARVVSISDRSITLKCDVLTNSAGLRSIIQIITLDNFENADKIFESFDFTVCMGAYDCDDKKFCYHESFWEDIASRRINFNVDTKYPYASLVRLGKYTKKGFSIPKSEYLKMGMSIARHGLPNSWDELENAIGGFYGKSLKLEVEDIDFNFDNAIEVLSNLKTKVEDDSENKNIQKFNKIIEKTDESMFDVYSKELYGNLPTLIKYGDKTFVYDIEKNSTTNVIYDVDTSQKYFDNLAYSYKSHEFAKFINKVKSEEINSGNSQVDYTKFRLNKVIDCPHHIVKHYMVALTCDINEVPHVLSKGFGDKTPFSLMPLTMETECDNMAAFAMNLNVAKTILEQATKDGTFKDCLDVKLSRFLFYSNGVTDYLNDELMIVKKGVVTIDSKKTI